MFKLLAVAITLFSLTAFANISPDAVPGEYVVKLKQKAVNFNQKALAKSLDAEIKEILPAHTQIVVVKRSTKESSKMAVESLAKSPMVEYVEPNYYYHAFLTPEDERYMELWGMKNVGQIAPGPTGQFGKPGIDIGAEEAWDITTGSKEIVVAVIDTGINYQKISDLRENLWVNKAEAEGVAGVDDDGNGYVDDIHGYDFAYNDADPNDKSDVGHGTHVAGTIGAKGNKKGVVGVNWNVSLMAIKFLDDKGRGTLDAAIKSIDYATMMGAQVLNNSWGGTTFSKAIKEAVERNNEAGALFIAAAGNSNANNDRNPHYPASYKVPNVISVAAINNMGMMASFSCYGRNSVHIGAPGQGILSTNARTKYEVMQGTSMAAPHVAGVAALVLSVAPELTHHQLKERLMRTARRIAGLRGVTVTGGMVNAYHAVTDTLAPPDPDDPANWEQVSFAVSTPHPYPLEFEKEYKFHVPGAQRIAVHFSKFELEYYWDQVEIYDGMGLMIGNMTGSRSDDYSPVAFGDTIIIKLISDDTEPRYGFDVDRVAVER
jgi:thermitase